MTHQEINQNEIVERYLLHKLPPEERHAFQEHFFDCDDCFQQVQTTSRFIAGVRHASRRGLLDRKKEALTWSWSSGWLKSALACSAVLLLLAVVFVWLWFNRSPETNRNLAGASETRPQVVAPTPNATDQAGKHPDDTQQPETNQNGRAKLDEPKLQRQPVNAQPRPDQNLIGQANIPTVTLESSRDSGTPDNQLAISPEATRIRLLIPVEPGNRFQSFTVQIIGSGKNVIETVKAMPNRAGTLSVSMPAGRFESGDYRVKLIGNRGPQQELVGDYDLRVVKK